MILYHTYLGPEEGRRRAAQHVREQSNLYLETSWCRWRVDGPHHYCRHPPNVEGQETYNEGLVPLVRALGSEPARKVLGDNARRLFRLNGNSHSS